MQIKLMQWVVASVLIATSGACDARTFKVLDTATDLPIVGVDAHIVIRGTLPGIGHPMETTLGEWNLKSDEKGEFSIQSPWSDEAFVELSKNGFVNIQTVKTYRLAKSSAGASKNILYMTRQADEVMESIKHLVERSSDGLKEYAEFIKTYPRSSAQMNTALIAVAVNYGESKSKARAERERFVLKEFCQFAPAMRNQRDAGWPNMGTLGSLRKDAEALIHDCELHQ